MTMLLTIFSHGTFDALICEFFCNSLTVYQSMLNGFVEKLCFLRLLNI